MKRGHTVSKKLLKNVAVYRNRVIEEGRNIEITDDRITAFPTDITDVTGYAEIIDGKGMLATPGFVNTHNHIAMTVFRSYADDMRLMDWLENKIWPAEAKLDGRTVYAQTLLGIAEMLRCGTTSFADMYFFMDNVAEAVRDSGIRACLSRGLTGITPNAAEALAENRDFFMNWHNSCNGRITVMFGPHAPYTCPEDYLRKVVETARSVGAEINMHL